MADRLVDTLVSVAFRPLLAVQDAQPHTGPVTPLPWRMLPPQGGRQRPRLTRHDAEAEEALAACLTSLLLARLRED